MLRTADFERHKVCATPLAHRGRVRETVSGTLSPLPGVYVLLLRRRLDPAESLVGGQFEFSHFLFG